MPIFIKTMFYYIFVFERIYVEELLRAEVLYFVLLNMIVYDNYIDFIRFYMRVWL